MLLRHLLGQGLEGAVEVTSFESGGRTYRIWKWATNSSDVALSVQGGTHATARETAHYRSGSAGPLKLPAPIVLRRERGRDRLAKRLGFSVEPQTGHREFDDLAYIETSSPPELVRALFREAGAAEAAAAVLRGCNEVVLGDPRAPLVAIRSHVDGTALTKEGQAAQVERLDALAGALPEIAATEGKPRGLITRLGGRGVVAWQLSVWLVAVAGVYGFLRSKPLDDRIGLAPMLAGLGLHVVLVFTLGRWLARRRPGGLFGRRNWLLNNLLLIGGLALAPSFVGIVGIVNEAADASNPTLLSADVVMYNAPGAGTDDSGKLVVTVDGGKRHEIAPDLMPSKGCRTLELTVRAGRFGRRWIQGARCTKP